jgi:predicted porin
MDIRAFDQVGFCSRNSALGFRGGFGNVWGGRWHTPFSRMYGIGSVGVEETGNLGMSNINGGSGSQSAVEQGAGNAGSLGRQRFRRRESCLTTYETPNMGGFMVGAAVTCGNAASTDGNIAAGTTVTSNANNTKPRVYSIAGTYNKGPLGLGLGYQRHVDFGTFNTVGAAELTDRAWGAAARYRFGPVLLGATYMDRKWEQADGDLKNRTWTVGAVWTIAGPHQLHVHYGDTGDSKGSSATRIGGQGGAEAPVVGGVGRGDTGYSNFSLAYQYSFSKRTTAKIGWARTSNDTNSRALNAYNTQSLSAAMVGQDTDSWSLVVKHRF